MPKVIDIPITVQDALRIGVWVKDGTPIPKVHEMREATPEELESVNNYIKSISKPTGVNIWDKIEEVTTDADCD